MRPHLIFSYCTSGSKSRSSTQTDVSQVCQVSELSLGPRRPTDLRLSWIRKPETKTRLCVNVIVFACQCQCQCQPECVALIHGTRMDGVMDMPATQRNRPDGSLSSRNWRRSVQRGIFQTSVICVCLGSCVLRSAFCFAPWARAPWPFSG